jgi:flagellar hook assembly protein FlgD
VAVLATGECAAGETLVEWDGRDTAGRDMPSGTYLVMLKTRSGMQVQKGVLVR